MPKLQQISREKKGILSTLTLPSDCIKELGWQGGDIIEGRVTGVNKLELVRVHKKGEFNG